MQKVTYKRVVTYNNGQVHEVQEEVTVESGFPRPQLKLKSSPKPLKTFTFVYQHGWFGTDSYYDVKAANMSDAIHIMNQRFPHESPVEIMS